MSEKQKHILIVGGGFAGITIARELLRYKFSHLRVTLVDKHPYHSFPPDYYELATAFLPKEKNISEDEEMKRMYWRATIPFTEIFKTAPHVFREGEVVLIDPEQTEVTFSDGSKLEYDYVVIAVGVEADNFHIPSIGRYALPLKNLSDVFKIRSAIRNAFATTPKQETITFVIGGGGSTGCEFASELVGYAYHLASLYGHPYTSVAYYIIEAGSSILGSLHPWVQKKAAQRLSELNVKIMTDSPITEVSEREVIVRGGKRISYSLLVWTGGIHGNKLVEGIQGCVTDEHVRIQVDAELRCKSHKNIYAAGDVALIQGQGGITIPATAVTAMHQGRYIARNIIDREEKRKPALFKPRVPPMIIPLGNTFALADLGWLRISGKLAWALKRLATLRYYLRLLSFRKAVTLWWSNTMFYLRND